MEHPQIVVYGSAILMNRKKDSTEIIASYMRDVQRLVGKVKIYPTQRDQ